ncbi:POLY polymerase [Salix viminalis]|uniref:POLY polymerase n=1 Tax=Salix viminalis TaxID=40686 RepID=A0A9Q0NHT0_SALVM|nr:POLY polymerase [Salix viminalis]
MGACVSSSYLGHHESHKQLRPQTAKVISIHGDLREYYLPAFVSQVLRSEIASSSSSSSSSSSWFLCNSDHLSYDEYIPVLASDVPLHAALAVKASLALQNSSKKGGSRRGKNARISPVLLVNPDHDQYQQYNVIYQKPRPKTQVKRAADSVAIGFSRSGSDRSFKKYTSRRAKLAVRSFKLRLTTIHEGTALN